MSAPIFRIFKIMIFGEPEALKNQLIKKYSVGSFTSSTKMAVGFDFKLMNLIVDQEEVKLQIWDFGGQERLKSMLGNYLRGTKGVLLIYDVTNQSTLMKIDDWLDIIRKHGGDNISLLLVGIIPERVEDREVSPEKGMKLAKSKGIAGFIECNVSTGENVEEVFIILVRLILKNLQR
jgi:small GTP-binding protein